MRRVANGKFVSTKRKLGKRDTAASLPLLAMKQIQTFAGFKQKEKLHVLAVPKSKWQSGGSMMLLLKLHPCVVTDIEKLSSQRKLHTNILQRGRTDTSQGTRQVRASLPRHQEQDRQPCAPASPEVSTASDYNLTSELPATRQSIQAKFHQQQLLNRSLKLHSYTRHKHSDPTSH